MSLATADIAKTSLERLSRIQAAVDPYSSMHAYHEIAAGAPR